MTFPEGSLDNILKEMDHAARVGMPVAVIQHTAPSKDSPTFRKGSDEWKLHPEVEKRKRDILIEKNLPGSFTGTELEKWLREQGIERVAICGYMTQMCCDTTARQAFHLGFQVDFLSDATGTLSVQNSAGSISGSDLRRAVLVDDGGEVCEGGGDRGVDCCENDWYEGPKDLSQSPTSMFRMPNNYSLPVGACGKLDISEPGSRSDMEESALRTNRAMQAFASCYLLF